MAYRQKRAREFGFTFGFYPTGPKNCLTDVSGVRVGEKTLIGTSDAGEEIRTGVTAILPHRGNLFQEKVIGASFVLNGFGKTTGLVQLEELGVVESPLMLTNTFSVPAATEGALHHLLAHNADLGIKTGTANIITAECNDGFLNDIRGMHVRPEHACHAIENATSFVAEGAIGAGTGMSCLGFKGGIGTSSRFVGGYTIGCLVLTNYGKRQDWIYSRHASRVLDTRDDNPLPDGSIIIVLATNAPLDTRQLKRLCKRGALGLGRTASYAANGSGDLVLAFSTANRVPHIPDSKTVPFSFLHDADKRMDELFSASAEAVEEAILNALCAAEAMQGFAGNSRPAFKHAISV